MGLIFDQNTTECYEDWYRSCHGSAMDEAISTAFRRMVRPKINERILEIGCGTGRHLVLFNSMGLNISGIDASPYAVNTAQGRLGYRASLKRAEAEDLPFEDNEFDLAVFINTLEFLENPLEALKEAGRVARRQVFIVALNSLSWKGVMKQAQGLFGHPLFRHARLMNLWRLKSLFHSAFGEVPISWNGISTRSSVLEQVGLTPGVSQDSRPFSLCTLLCASAAMICRVKTDNLPLSVRLKKAGIPLAGTNTFLHSNSFIEAEENERSSAL